MPPFAELLRRPLRLANRRRRRRDGNGGRPLRVAIDLVFHNTQAGGIGTYARELCSALADRDDVELYVFIGRKAPPELLEAPWMARAHVTRLPVAYGGRLALLAAFASLIGIPAIALARRFDVLHGVGNSGAVAIPGLACVITMHDVVFRREATEWAPANEIAIADRNARRVARFATLILCVSEAAAADVGAELRIEPERIAVARSGVRASPMSAAERASDPQLVLYVAQKRRYKNHMLLIEAFAKLADRDAQLVLPAQGALDSELRERAEQLGIADRVSFPGWVDDARLAELYATATCVVQPSRYEGFGLPVLEAMSAGVAVACSAIPPHLEIAGDAALTFSPSDADACAAAIDALLDDPDLRARLVSAGRVRAAEWTWERCAEETVAAYRYAVARRSRAPASATSA